MDIIALWLVDGAGCRLVEMDNHKLDCKRVAYGTATGIPVGRLPLLCDVSLALFPRM